MFLLSFYFHYLFIFQISIIKKKLLIEEKKPNKLMKSFLPEVILFAIQTRKVSIVRHGCVP